MAILRGISFCSAQKRHGYASGAATMGTSACIKNKVSWAPGMRAYDARSCMQAGSRHQAVGSGSRQIDTTSAGVDCRESLPQTGPCHAIPTGAQHLLSSHSSCSRRSARPTATLHQPKSVPLPCSAGRRFGLHKLLPAGHAPTFRLPGRFEAQHLDEQYST